MGSRRLKFSEVGDVERSPGIYEIYTLEGVPLKVGIAGDLRRRLVDHGRSAQSGLKFRVGNSARTPRQVVSKRSILAKHLYFDTSIAPDYDSATTSIDARWLMTKSTTCASYLRLSSSLEN